MLRGPPLSSETMLTGDFWAKALEELSMNKTCHKTKKVFFL